MQTFCVKKSPKEYFLTLAHKNKTFPILTDRKGKNITINNLLKI